MTERKSNRGQRWRPALFVFWFLVVTSFYLYHQWKDYQKAICLRGIDTAICHLMEKIGA